jgi:hypothetical protein
MIAGLLPARFEGRGESPAAALRDLAQYLWTARPAIQSGRRRSPAGRRLVDGHIRTAPRHRRGRSRLTTCRRTAGSWRFHARAVLAMTPGRWASLIDSPPLSPGPVTRAGRVVGLQCLHLSTTRNS